MNKENIKTNVIKYYTKNNYKLPIDFDELNKEELLELFIDEDETDIKFYLKIIFEKLNKKLTLKYYMMNDNEIKDYLDKNLFNNNSINKLKSIDKSKNTCPKIRIPINGKCNKEYSIIKKNKQGFECCYKK